MKGMKKMNNNVYGDIVNKLDECEECGDPCRECDSEEAGVFYSLADKAWYLQQDIVMLCRICKAKKRYIVRTQINAASCQVKTVG